MIAMAERSRESREVFRKHHPGLLQSDEQIIRQFVVREPELEILLDVLRGNLDSPSCQHALILGPRGRGKSTLLARVAAEIRTNAQFAPRLLPVRFTDESAEVFDAVSFWLDTLLHLANELEARDPEFAAELRGTRTDVIRRWQDAALEERARAAVLAAAERLDRRLVLMVENLHVLFGGGNEDFGWKLRATLQSEPRIILLGSATTRFTALDDARAPFFELFHTVSLDPLNTEDCKRLWERVAGESLEGRDIRPIEILTGGSPRLLVIVGQFAERLSARGLMERLAALIDDHSEYFRSQLDALPSLERQVFLALADLWQPSEAGEIAARARMDVRTVSVMLGRLRKRGAVITQRAGKKRRHALAERLFCIYYKLRRERNEAGVVHNLIRYMASFYRPDEWADRFSDLLIEANSAPGVRDGLARVLAERPELAAIFEDEEHEIAREVRRLAESIQDEQAERSLLRIAAALDARAYDTAAAEINRTLAPGGAVRSAVSDTRRGILLLIKSVAQASSGDTKAMMGSLREFLDRYATTRKPVLRKYVGTAFVGIARCEIHEGMIQEGIETCRRTIELYKDGKPHERQFAASALNTLGHAYEQAGDTEAARGAYEELLRRFETSDAPGVGEQVAAALASLGLLRAISGSPDAGLAYQQRLVDRFGDETSQGYAVPVGVALLGISVEIQQRGEARKALGAANDAVDRLRSVETPRVRPLLASALVRMGGLLMVNRDYGAAAKAYAEAAEDVRGRGPVELDIQVAEAFAGLGLAYAKRGKLASATEKWEEMLERFRDHGAPEVQSQVCRVLTLQAIGKIGLGSTAEAVALCDEVEARLDRVTDSARPSLTWEAHSLRSKARLKEADVDAAVGAFRAAYDVFAPDSEVMMRDIQKLVPDLVVAGASPADLLRVLTSDVTKAEALSPLVASLGHQMGEPVRGPVEVLEVAKDTTRLMRSRGAGSAA